MTTTTATKENPMNALPADTKITPNGDKFRATRADGFREIFNTPEAAARWLTGGWAAVREGDRTEVRSLPNAGRTRSRG